MSSAIPQYSLKQILSLYRSCLRSAAKFENYNFREYFLRKTKDSFRSHAKVTNAEDIHRFILKGQEDLKVLNRQSTISQMYHFDKSVVEKL